MSELIESYRRSVEGRSNEELVGAYYELLAKISEAGEKGDRRKLVQYCTLSLPFVEPLIRENTTHPRPSPDLLASARKAFPDLPHEEVERLCSFEPDGSAVKSIPFRIKSIPAIEELAEIWGQEGNRAQLANLRELVWYFPELEPWRKDIEDAERVIELRPRFERFFREHGDYLRKDLPKAFPDIPPELVERIVYDLVEVGVLDTGKQGRFVSIFLKKHKQTGLDA